MALAPARKPSAAAKAAADVDAGCAGVQQVLKAARELFAAHGFDGVSIQDVASRAGVSKANVFHHFASKEALYLDVLRAAVSRNLTRTDALVAESGCFETRLRQLLHNKLEDMLQDERETRLVMREVLEGGSERAHELATQVFKRNAELQVDFFRRAQASGQMRPDLEPGVAASLVGACAVMYFQCRDVMRHMPGHDHARDIGPYVEAVTQVLVGGLRMPSATPSETPASVPASSPIAPASRVRTRTTRPPNKHRSTPP